VGKGMTALLNLSAHPFSLYGNRLSDNWLMESG
jgi:hypothetical protein